MNHEHELDLLKNALLKIRNMGWIKNRRPNNCGGVGNTLEDLLGVPENNLQLPDYGNWELKTQRNSSSALVTLFHQEPEPRRMRIIPKILLPIYGWPHQDAGITYPSTERSFRQTINASIFSDRGFKVFVNRNEHIVYVDFDPSMVAHRHLAWKEEVMTKTIDGLLIHKPYWTFSSLEIKLRAKLHNLVFVHVDSRNENGIEYFKYKQFNVYIKPTLEAFLSFLENGNVYIDFDARTGHNHGTKFRVQGGVIHHLYEHFIKV